MRRIQSIVDMSVNNNLYHSLSLKIKKKCTGEMSTSSAGQTSRQTKNCGKEQSRAQSEMRKVEEDGVV